MHLLLFTAVLRMYYNATLEQHWNNVTFQENNVTTGNLKRDNKKINRDESKDFYSFN
jgi:hypothetical protein